MFTRDIERVRAGRGSQTVNNLATGLGAFSLALGLFEMAAPGQIARWLGLGSHKPLLRGYGGREIMTGVGILAGRRQSRWFVWGRVAGDAADLATLGAGLASSKRKANVAIALGVVAAVAAADVFCALQLTRGAGRSKQPVRDYAARSGFPRGIASAFGVALREAQDGLDWWDSWRRNLGRGGAELLAIDGRGREDRGRRIEIERGEYAGRA